MKDTIKQTLMSLSWQAEEVLLKCLPKWIGITCTLWKVTLNAHKLDGT